MIRNISYELLDKTHNTTDILLKFEDNGIKKEFYDFIKDHLEDFRLDNIKGYSITIDTECDCTTNMLIIQIVLSIPDIHKSIDMELEQIINHISNKFTKFYERNVQLFDSKNNGDK